MPKKLTERYVYMDEWSFFLPEWQKGVLQREAILSVHGTLKIENRNWKFGFHAL